MDIRHKKVNQRGIFYIEEDGNVVAEMVYSETAPGNMIIEHTEVDEDLRGQNIGYELVEKSVDYARSHHMKILPVCPFAKAIFDKKPDFSDVLGEE